MEVIEDLNQLAIQFTQQISHPTSTYRDLSGTLRNHKLDRDEIVLFQLFHFTFTFTCHLSIRARSWENRCHQCYIKGFSYFYLVFYLMLTLSWQWRWLASGCTKESVILKQTLCILYFGQETSGGGHFYNLTELVRRVHVGEHFSS